MIIVLSYTNDGILTLLIDGKREEFFNVSPFQFEYIQKLIRQGDKEKLFKQLKKHAKPDYLNLPKGQLLFKNFIKSQPSL